MSSKRSEPAIVIEVTRGQGLGRAGQPSHHVGAVVAFGLVRDDLGNPEAAAEIGILKDRDVGHDLLSLLVRLPFRLIAVRTRIVERCA